MSNNILDTKFKHHSWFKNSGLTKRQAIEEFAYCGDFVLDKKPSKIQSDNLFDAINYESIIVYCSSKQRSTYRLTEEEKEYYLKRKKFWLKFNDRMNKEYEAKWMEKGQTATGYEQWREYEKSEKMKVPEYKSYIEAFRRAI